MFVESRVIGAAAKRIITHTEDTIDFNYQRFLFNTLFSDHYILDSVMLREIPFLVRRFGYLGTRSLLLSKDFSFQCETYGVGICNASSTHPFIYRLMGFDVENRQDYLQSCLGVKGFNEDLEGYVTEINKINLLDLINEKLLPYPETPLESISKQIIENIKESDVLKKIIARKVKLQLGQSIKWHDLKIEIITEDYSIYQIRNNLNKLIRRTELEAHEIIKNCVSAFCYQFVLAYKMEQKKAFGCYKEGEEHILLDSLPALTKLNVDSQIECFHRIIEIKGLPDLDKVEGLKITELLALKTVPEYVEFRKLMNDAQELSDKEIEDELNHMASKICSIIEASPLKTPYKIMSFAISCNLDLCGNIALHGAEFILPWLTNKILSPKGHAVFLEKYNRSVFD